MCPVQTYCIIEDRQWWEKKGNVDTTATQKLIRHDEGAGTQR